MSVLDRSIAVLEILSAQNQSIGVIELSKQAKIPASTLHRLMIALSKHGLVAQDTHTRRYRLGSGVLRLARAYLQQNTLVSIAQEHLAELRNELQETVFLTALLGDDAVCVATAESPRPLQFYMRVGQRMPYHAAASARVILAFQAAADVERLLRREALNSFTDSTQTNPSDVLAELKQVRKRGYAICDEEMEVGVTAIAAPVRDASGQVAASVTSVAPTVRLASGTVRQRLLRNLLETANRIAVDLGHGAEPSQRARGPLTSEIRRMRARLGSREAPGAGASPVHPA